MSDFFKSRTFIAAMVLTVLLAVYAAVSTSGQKNTFLSNFAGMIAAPFQSAFSAVGDGFAGMAKYFNNIEALSAENETLKEQIKTYERELLDFERYKEENERLNSLLALKESGEGSYQTQAAKVIAKETRNFSTVFVIDKGSFSGIEKNDAVITGDGLLGYILEVGPNFSKIATLFEIDTAVGAICIRTSDSGVLEGDLEYQIEGYCKMDYLSKETTMVVGDYVETSGYGGIYPAGLLIGRVEEIALKSHGISQCAKIKPAADLKNPTEVLVIVSFSGEEKP